MNYKTDSSDISKLVASATNAFQIGGRGHDDFTNYYNALGEQGDDTLTANAAGGRLSGGTGNDELMGGASSDQLFGDADSDRISGNGSDDFIWGGAGADLLYGDDGMDTIFGGEGSDRLFGGSATDFLFGGDGDDKLDGGTSPDSMNGELGNDIYYVDDVNDVVFEAPGGGIGDYIFAIVSYTSNANIERLYLDGAASINATGVAGQIDILIGNGGNNVLNGLSGNDVMRGGLGNDTYFVDAAGDTTDEVTGGGGLADYVYASVSFTAAAGIERLYLTGTAANGTGRDAQNDIITGNAVANSLSGLSGNDVLIGGLGNDTLNGGLGLDIFRFDTAPNSTTNRDTIIGFVAADDTIQLENAVFTALTVTGTLAAAAFNTGAAATQADDRIIYNTATGALLYDADGLGGVTGVQFATLSGNAAISNVDFFVF